MVGLVYFHVYLLLLLLLIRCQKNPLKHFFLLKGLTNSVFYLFYGQSIKYAIIK